MAAFDDLPPASFIGVSFPVDEVTVTGGLRDHVHEYPHSPGGAPEKLGRKLYTIRMSALFMNVFPKWGTDLWPGNLADLRDAFEDGTTGALVIPTIGSIQAYCTNWTQHMAAKIRSGEKCEFEFREDQSSEYLLSGIVNVQASSMATAIDQMILVAEAEDIDSSLFDSIQGLFNQIQAVGDQVDLYSNLIAAKAEGIASLCDQLDKTLTDLTNPAHFRVLDAIKDVWDSSLKLNKDVLKRSVPLIPYTTPTVMSVTDVANAYYGDAKRAIDIMTLNPLPDPFSISSGTTLLIYAI